MDSLGISTVRVLCSPADRDLGFWVTGLGNTKQIRMNERKKKLKNWNALISKCPRYWKWISQSNFTLSCGLGFPTLRSFVAGSLCAHHCFGSLAACWHLLHSLELGLPRSAQLFPAAFPSLWECSISMELFTVPVSALATNSWKNDHVRSKKKTEKNPRVFDDVPLKEKKSV